MRGPKVGVKSFDPQLFCAVFPGRPLFCREFTSKASAILLPGREQKFVYIMDRCLCIQSE